MGRKNKKAAMLPPQGSKHKNKNKNKNKKCQNELGMEGKGQGRHQKRIEGTLIPREEGEEEEEEEAEEAEKPKVHFDGEVNHDAQSVDTPIRISCPLPVSSNDKVLLIGEGDLSFSLSLHNTHKFTSLTCTVFDSEQTLHSKYPQSATTVTTLRSAGHTVLFNVDGTKPPKAINKRAGTWDAIIFMFPHTGGLTKDVDRQIRVNQELVLGFFTQAKKLMEPMKGVVIVTTFAGKPYEEWDIRSLAKSLGLRVRRSGVFEWKMFPGYKHARTLGNVVPGRRRVRGKGGGGTGGEGGGGGAGGGGGMQRAGWRGEDRPARMWVFEVDDGKVLNAPRKNKRKRGNMKGQSDSGSDSDSSPDYEKKRGKKRKKRGEEKELDGGKGNRDEVDIEGSSSGSVWTAGDVQSQELHIRQDHFDSTSGD